MRGCPPHPPLSRDNMAFGLFRKRVPEATATGVEAKVPAAAVATEVKALAVQTQNATEEITRKIEALQRDAAGSVDAVHRISQAIELIRPVFDNVNGAVAEQSSTTGEMSDNAASASHFIVS